MCIYDNCICVINALVTFNVWIQCRICYCDAHTWPDFLITFMLLNQSWSCLFYSFWGDKFVFREWMRMSGKVKVTVVSLHQTHHSRHYSKLFHKIIYYRKCLANCTWCIFIFALPRLPSRERNNKIFFSRKTMRSIKFAQFQYISSNSFLACLPSFSSDCVVFFFWLAKKKFFSWTKGCGIPVRKSDIMTVGH